MLNTKSHQPRLILTPKVSSPFGSVPLRPGIAKLVDPNPDFDLLDVRLELEEIEARNALKYGSPLGFRDPAASSEALTGVRRFGGNVAEVADFGRGGFRMQFSDSDLSSSSDDDAKGDDDDDDESEDEDATTPVALPERTPHSPLEEQQFASPSGRTNVYWWASSGREGSPLLPKADEAETALREVNREMLLKVKEEIKQTQLNFEEQFNLEQKRAAQRFSELEREAAARRERARRTDKQDHRMIAEARDVHLSALQRDHEQRTQVEERAIRREVEAEEARKKALERQKEQERRVREEAEAVKRRKAEAEQEKAAKDAAERKAKADAAAAAAHQRAARQQAEMQEKVKQEAQEPVVAKLPAKEENVKALSSGMPRPRVSEEAAREESERLIKLKDMQDSFKSIINNPDLKSGLRSYERQIIKHLLQVSATQEQVRKKSNDLINLFKAPNGPPLQYLAVTLGAKILSQCESQVQKLPSFAFALAQVVANVASQVPLVMDAVLAQLHQACIFTVPKYYPSTKDIDNEAYYEVMGYHEVGGKWESTDDYVARMNAYVTFYAALAQTEVSGGTNPHGLAEAWKWCSRLLNRVPANRYTASALEAFLKTAGYRLNKVYPKPFWKLMNAVVKEYLVSLKSPNDKDATAVLYRLETYLHMAQFEKPPEGYEMPLKDISSQMR